MKLKFFLTLGLLTIFVGGCTQTVPAKLNPGAEKVVVVENNQQIQNAELLASEPITVHSRVSFFMGPTFYFDMMKHAHYEAKNFTHKSKGNIAYLAYTITSDSQGWQTLSGTVEAYQVEPKESDD